MEKQNQNNFDLGFDELAEADTQGGGENTGHGIQLTAEQKKDIVLEEKKYEKLLSVVGIILIIFGVIIYVLFATNKFYKIGAKEVIDDTERAFIDDYKSKKDYIFGLFGIGSSTESQIQPPTDSKSLNINNLKTAIDSEVSNLDISYIDKKDHIKAFFDGVYGLYKKDEEDLKRIKTDFAKYAFLPKVIDDILEGNQIQSALVAVESIKLFTAIDTFGKLNSFLKSASMYLGQSEGFLKGQFLNYIKRGEADTQRYLVSCYFNPYEYESNNEPCVRFKDFEMYYNYIKDRNFDYTTFKKILKYIEQNIEFGDFQRFSIVLNSLDPKSNKISFSIEVNSFDDDMKDYSMANNGDLHTNIVTSIIKLLRQSHYILGKTINATDVSINKKKIVIGENQFEVNNSRFNFDVPLQSKVDREIYDYYKK